jgi:hypothetical protein
MPHDLEYAAGSAVSVSTTEMSLATDGGTTVGVPQSKTDAGLYQLVLDAFAMAKGDEYAVKIYEKAVTGGTQRLVEEIRLMDAQASLFYTPQLQLGLGWDITLDKIAGTDRAFSWSIRRVHA